MFHRKEQKRRMPTSEEFALWGARELTYEELLEVNGGRHVIDDPRTDDISDTIADGGHSPRGSESTGNNGSSGGSSGGGSSAPPSFSSSEPVTGSDSDDTGGGYTDYWEGACTDWYESGGSSGGGSSNGSSGSSDNHSSDSGNADSGSSDDSWGGSSDNDSSDSGGSYTGGSYTGGGYTYTPPVQNQEPPAQGSPGAQGQELPNTGGMPSVSQKPDTQASAEPEPKKGWGEKIRDWFDGKREEVVGSIKERFSRGSKGSVGEKGNNTNTKKDLPDLEFHLLRHPDSYTTFDGKNRENRGKDLLILENKTTHKSIITPVSSVANMPGFGAKDTLAEGKFTLTFDPNVKSKYAPDVLTITSGSLMPTIPFADGETLSDEGITKSNSKPWRAHDTQYWGSEGCITGQKNNIEGDISILIQGLKEYGVTDKIDIPGSFGLGL